MCLWIGGYGLYHFLDRGELGDEEVGWRYVLALTSHVYRRKVVIEGSVRGGEVNVVGGVWSGECGRK